MRSDLGEHNKFYMVVIPLHYALLVLQYESNANLTCEKRQQFKHILRYAEQEKNIVNYNGNQ